MRRPCWTIASRGTSTASFFWAATTCTCAYIPGNRRSSCASGSIRASKVCARASPVGATLVTRAGMVTPGCAGTDRLTVCPARTCASRASSTVTWISTAPLVNARIGELGVANAPGFRRRWLTTPSNGATIVV
jgi:hypothetical protein